MSGKPTDGEREQAYEKRHKLKRDVLLYLKDHGQQHYNSFCALFDCRGAVGIDSLLYEMREYKLIDVASSSVSITDSGLKWLELDEKNLKQPN